jgi:hypothetical protein
MHDCLLIRNGPKKVHRYTLVYGNSQVKYELARGDNCGSSLSAHGERTRELGEGGHSVKSVVTMGQLERRKPRNP